MEIYNPRSYKRFPWTQKLVDLLIDLYAKKIDIFLDPNRTQKSAWIVICNELKKKVNGSSVDLLTIPRVINKFAGLKKIFKTLFFDFKKSETEKQKVFPFYTKMSDLFINYATRSLQNSSIYKNSLSMSHDKTADSSHNISQADVTSYLVQLLNEEDIMDKTSLTIIPYEDHENFSEHVSSVNYTNSQQLSKNLSTENEKIRIKLAEIPSENIYICQEKMRIDPNTPFNRRVNSSTILNQRSMMLHNTQATYMKRKLENDLEPQVKRKPTIPIAHSSHRLSKSFADDEYMIEALDECELSDITMRQSKAIYHCSSAETSSTLSKEENPQVQQQYEKNYHVELEESTIQKSITEVQNSMTEVKESIHSLLEIPSCPVFNDDSSIDEPRLRANLSDTIRGVPREIRPKKLNIESNESGSSQQVSLVAINDNQPPVWFQKFLKKYDNDIKSINAKLDKLISSRNNESNNKKPVLIHPKVLSLKRDSI